MSTSSLPGSVLREAINATTFQQVVLQPLSRIAFWMTIVLPFLYMPLLLTGLESRSVALAFLALVALNVVTLLLGHPHGRE